MVKQIISADAWKTRKVFQKDGENYLNISEFFYDTIQGEGIYAGHPAAFLRLQGCGLGCSFCDSTEVWKHGSRYTFDELFNLMENTNLLIPRLYEGQHLVITGGSPLLQEEHLLTFIEMLIANWGWAPFIEIENEAIITPSKKWGLVSTNGICWNNSPKLSSSGVEYNTRVNRDALKWLSKRTNSWFKFVVSKEEDWKEIEDIYLRSIEQEQIILMPQGATRAELEKNRPIVVEMAIQHGVRYSDRLHIQLWDKKIGV